MVKPHVSLASKERRKEEKKERRKEGKKERRKERRKEEKKERKKERKKASRGRTESQKISTQTQYIWDQLAVAALFLKF